MNTQTDRKQMRERSGRFDWVIELAIFATITPAIVYGVLALENLPVVA